MARKSEVKAGPLQRQDSRLALRAKQDVLVGGVPLVVAVVLMWWNKVPLSFNADSPVIMLFVAAVPFGTVFLALGLWKFIRHRRSGGAWLEYHPLHDGGTLAGVVRLNRMPDPLPDFTLTMQCRTRLRDRSSDSEASPWRVTWTKEIVVSADSVRANNGIPLSIGLPRSTHAGPVINQTWELQVRAPLPGLDFYQVFEPKFSNL